MAHTNLRRDLGTIESYAALLGILIGYLWPSSDANGGCAT